VEESNCVPCNVATALGLAKDICKTYQELDCSQIQEILDHPDIYTTDDTEKAIIELAEKAEGEPKEVLDCLVSLMHGEECHIVEGGSHA